MNLVKRLFKKYTDVTLLVVALFVYLVLALTINQRYIGSDGRSYQRMAVNIAEGNGYSNSIEPPFERQFFREPGFPFFFSIACFINKQAGNENIPLSYKDPSPGYYESPHTEILILRILQAFLASLSVWLFYKTLLFFLKPRLAVLISFLFIFYLPFTIFVTFPQREILVTTLLTGMGYLYLKSATLNKPLWFDIIFGLLAAYLVLTLQAYIFILPIFLLSHIFITKNIKKSLKSLTIICSVFILGVAPWSYRGYKEANDIRAIKSFGISYTYEFRKFHEANARAYYADFEGNKKIYKQQIYNAYSEPGKLMFEKSFNGYYLSYADSLNNAINLKAAETKMDWFKYNIRNVLTINFRKAMVWPLWKTDYRKNISSILEENGSKVMIISMAIGIIISLLSISGMILFIRKTWLFMPVFVFHFLMIPFIADEGRRVLPFLPFYFMFFLLSIHYIVHKIKSRQNRETIKSKIFTEIKPFII
jgi:hypothetical protein